MVGVLCCTTGVAAVTVTVTSSSSGGAHTGAEPTVTTNTNTATTETTTTTTAAGYGDDAVPIDDVDAFQRVLTTSMAPVLVLLLPPPTDDAGSSSDDVAARVRHVSSLLTQLGVFVMYTSVYSPLAQQLRTSLALSVGENVTAMLFQGIHETELPEHKPVTDDGDAAAAAQTTTSTTRHMRKIAAVYPAPWYVTATNRLSGRHRVHYYHLLRWAIGALSPACLHRLESIDDVHTWLTPHARYGDLPRVLYVTAASSVSPQLRVLSQMFCGDAVFGVVVDAFASATNGSQRADAAAATARRAIAQHYGVAKASDAPALMVLHPRHARDDATSAHDAAATLSAAAYAADEVHRMPHCYANTSLDDVVDFLASELPNSYERAARANNSRAWFAAVRRQRYLLRQLEHWYRTGNVSNHDDDVDADGDDASGDDSGSGGGGGDVDDNSASSTDHGDARRHGDKATRTTTATPHDDDDAALPDVRLATTQHEWQRACPLPYDTVTSASSSSAAAARHCLVVFADGDGTPASRREQQQYAADVLRDAVAQIARQSPSLGRAAQLQGVVLPAARSGALMRWFDVGGNGLPDVLLLLHTPTPTHDDAAASHDAPTYVALRYVGAFTADRIADFYVRKARLLAGRGADAVDALGGRRLSPHHAPPPLQDAATTTTTTSTAAPIDANDDEDDARGDL